MKKLNFILLVSFPFLFWFCSENNVNENTLGKGLEFYYLMDSTLTTSQAMNLDINDLILYEEPFLTYRDLHYYRWHDHTFEIDSLKKAEISVWCRSHQSVLGIPFIVTIDKERIYLGAFWFLYSSIAPPCPYIDDLLFMQDKLTELSICKSLMDIETDVRNDERIYNSLQRYGLLRE